MTEIFDLASTIAQRHDLDPLLVGAIIRVESAGNPFSVRYEPHWIYFKDVPDFARRLMITEATESLMQMCSWGPMQVMGAVARELGFTDYLQKLCEPVLGITYGCKKLQAIKRRYSSTEDIVAAYNAGTPKKNERGVYFNQNYVDKVLGIYNSLKLAGGI